MGLKEMVIGISAATVLAVGGCESYKLVRNNPYDSLSTRITEPMDYTISSCQNGCGGANDRAVNCFPGMMEIAGIIALAYCFRRRR